MLFIVPLVILVAGYALGLWFAGTGRRFVRRFFFLPVLASLALTLFVSLRYERSRLAPPPAGTSHSQPDDPVHFLPLYALRVAPIALGACLILNASAHFGVAAIHRRSRKSSAPVAADG